MKKIAIIVKGFHTTGISSVIMNYCFAIDKRDLKFTIISCAPINYDYVKKCKDNDIDFIELPRKHFYSSLKMVLDKDKFDIAYIHGSSCLIYPEVRIAKKCSVKHIITHCHNTKSNHILLHYLFKPLLNNSVTTRIACGDDAGSWMYANKKFYILRNGVDIKKYSFDIEKRKKIRKQLGITPEQFVIGHIGRFNNAKNQKFIINLFETLERKNPNIRLVLIGNGENYKALADSVQRKKYSGKIHFIGEINNPYDYYNIFDFFLLPSLHEGMPVVIIEAQTNGLNSIISDNVSKEIDYNNSCMQLPLDNPDDWIETIINSAKQRRTDRAFMSRKYSKKLKSNNYDIIDSSIMLKKILCKPS